MNWSEMIIWTLRKLCHLELPQILHLIVSRSSSILSITDDYPADPSDVWGIGLRWFAVNQSTQWEYDDRRTVFYLPVDDWRFQYKDKGDHSRGFDVERWRCRLLRNLVMLRGRVSGKFDIYLRTQIGSTLRSFEQLFSIVVNLRTRSKHDSNALSSEASLEKAFAVQISRGILRSSEFLHSPIENERHSRSCRRIHIRSIYQ